MGQWRGRYTEHAYCEILAGVSVLRDQAGNARTVSAGDRLMLAAGFSGTREELEPGPDTCLSAR